MILRYLSDKRGAAAVDVAIWLAALLLPTMSAVDVGSYLFQQIQVKQAAQVGVQSLFALCNSAATGKNYPVTTNCPNVNTTATTALQSTSLGSAVTWSSLNEGWYCGVISGTNANLTLSGSQDTMNSAGTTTGSMTSTQPTCANGAPAGDYVQANVSYTYRPPFGGLSIVTTLGGATINQSAWMRIN